MKKLIKKKIKEGYRQGNEEEGEFINDLIDLYRRLKKPMEVRIATKEEQWQHFDVVLKTERGKYKIDVKGRKSWNVAGHRWHGFACHWLERTNRFGNPGWMFGKADTIAFMDSDEWLIVEMDRLREYYAAACHADEAAEPPSDDHQLYVHYQQYGNPKAEIVLVPTSDLARIARSRVRRLKLPFKAEAGKIYTTDIRSQVA